MPNLVELVEAFGQLAVIYVPRDTLPSQILAIADLFSRPRFEIVDGQICIIETDLTPDERDG